MTESATFIHRYKAIFRGLTTTLLVILTLLLLPPAPCLHAQDATAKEDEEWRFIVAPYLWMSSLNGEVSSGGRSADVDVSFGDIWDNLDLGAQLHLEAWRGRWGAFTDMTYLSLSDNPVGVDVDTRLWLVEFGGLYQLWKGDFARNWFDELNFDALAGGRYWNGRISIDPPNFSKAERSRDWADPFIGGRLQGDIVGDLFFDLRGDIGGFGVASHFTWSATGLLGYRFTPLFSVLAGYRALGVNYEQGGFGLDTTMRGPILGAAFSF